MLELLVFASIPFYPQNFNVELIATWSDGDSTTYGTDVAITPYNWVYILTADYSGSSHYFYVLDGRHFPDSGFHLVDTVYDSVNYIGALTLWKDYLYAQTGYGVSVYDISDRANPRFIRRVLPPGKEGKGEGKGISSRRLYVFELPQDTILMDGLGSIWSLSIPDSPAYLTDLGRDVWYFELLYPYLYAINHVTMSLEVYDLSDPRNPVLVYRDTNAYDFNGALAIYQDSAGNYFMAQGDFWSNKIGIYSLENPERPEPVGIVNNPFDCTEKMVVHNNRVYASTMHMVIFQGGMDSSHIVGYFQLHPTYAGMTSDLKWANGYIFLARAANDLVVLRYKGDIFGSGVGESQASGRLRAWFSKGKLFFKAPEGLDLTLKVYDSKGALVLKESLSIPKGTSSKALELPSKGVYFALLENERTKTRRVVKCFF